MHVVRMMTYTDRSRIEAFQKCPRLRYWGYEHGGRGLQLEATTAMNIGTCVHEGVAYALGLCREVSSSDFNGKIGAIDFEAMLAKAREPLVYRSLDQDAADMVWALLYTWYVEGSKALVGWQIHDVEREEVFEHADVTFLSRSDWIASRDGALYNWNLKTWRTCDERRRLALQYDAQKFTELFGPEQRYQRSFAGVVYQILVKENHPLVWAWRHLKSGEIAARYQWVCETAHENVHKRKPDWCPGGKTHRLGGDWESIAVRDIVGGQQEWAKSVPLDLLREFHVILGPFPRPSNWEMEEWKRQHLNRELYLRQNLDDAASPLALFPQHTAHGNCVFPSECSALGLCWGGQSPEEFAWRVPNHPEPRAGLQETT